MIQTYTEKENHILGWDFFHDCYPRTKEVYSGDSRVQGHKGCMVRYCIKKQKKNNHTKIRTSLRNCL